MTAADSVSGCPDRDDLLAFALGDLSAVAIGAVEAHLRACAACSADIAAHDAAADPLLTALRGVDPAVADAAVDPGQRLLRELRQGPTRLGRFELLEELGKGSFGHVFRARDSELDRVVALKVERAGALAGPAEHERFVREARSAAQLEHEGIVTLYETGRTDDGVHYLVTEFIDGMTLERLIATDRPGFAAAAQLVAAAAMALQFAHSHGVVHRDIKPSNVLVDADRRPHIADFGLARRDGGEATVTPDGEVMGTPAYMAPELARGESHDVDGRCDVYSLGVILYELLTGERPFQGNRRMLLLAVLDEEPRPPHRLDERVPRDLETICLKALAKSPQRRYASAQAFADDLLRQGRGEPIHARPVGRTERAWRWTRRNPLATGLLIAVVVVSALGFWHLTTLSRELVRRSAFESAEQYSDLLMLVNDLYSEEVVERLGHHGIHARADYLQAPGAIPLPATLLRLLLAGIGDTDSGMRGRQYSEYPFKTQRDGGPRDDFERAALANLERQPSLPFFDYVDDGAGRPVLRYARARVMQESCVTCHNNHPDSGKTDWKVGDVRGVLEIVRPLAGDEERTRRGLRLTFVLIGTVGAALFAGILLVAVWLGRRRSV